MALKSVCSAALPTIFLPHGGGPLPILRPDKLSETIASLLQPGKVFDEHVLSSVTTILFISAHWEEPQATLTSSPNPGLYFDYYGFPQECYEYKWNAPGQPEVAQRIASLLSASGIETKLDSERNFDHGVFVPGILMAPSPTIPVVQLSLLNSLDPTQHIELGKALQPLREEGILIISSGLSYHNMGGFFGKVSGASKHAEEFDSYLDHACCKASPDERQQLLINWSHAPYARECHPREEHLIPLHVAAGAAPNAKGRRFFTNKWNGEGVKMGGWVFEDV